MRKLHLKLPGFTYIACGPYTQDPERIQKLKEAGKNIYI